MKKKELEQRIRILEDSLSKITRKYDRLIRNLSERVNDLEEKE